MEKQDIIDGTNKDFKEAFRHFYRKVKDYYSKRDSTKKICYFHICEYISGHLSNNADLIDLEWYRNERDLGGFSKKVNGKVYAYCQDKVLNEGNLPSNLHKPIKLPSSSSINNLSSLT